MAELVLYMGKSGCGKSTSLRYVDPKKTIIITPNGKSLPIPGADKTYIKGKNLIATNDLLLVQPTIQHINDTMPDVNLVVIEDFTHFFSARIHSPAFLAEGKGKNPYERWNVFGHDVFNTVFSKCDSWRDDLIILVLHHVEVKEDGSIGFRSSGKLLDNSIDVPSYFTYVFHGVVEQQEDGSIKYLMQTNKDNIREAKTAPGSFPDLRIPNDMNKALQRIRDYKAGKVGDIKFID